MQRSKLSLKWLEVFQAVAHHGSISIAATKLGISVSTVSHQLTCLERTMDVDLIDHGKRPMQLTSQGELLLQRVDEALSMLRKGVVEVWAQSMPTSLRRLRIALIEDFDTHVAPALAEHLTRSLPNCELSMLSRPSHQIFQLLQSEQVDIGIASNVELGASSWRERPLLRDPFVLVTPSQDAAEAGSFLSGEINLPLLRYSEDQILGRRIELQLRREGRQPMGRMTFESTHAILALVAAGRGWAITTALNASTVKSHGERLRLVPYPGKAFARQISLFAGRHLPEDVDSSLAQAMRRFAQSLVVDPLTAQEPWLAGQLHQLDETL